VTYGTAGVRPTARKREPVCPHCGTPVNDVYDYCGRCAGRLPPRRARR
jgi:predicted amidophosphoribosyltransferase